MNSYKSRAFIATVATVPFASILLPVASTNDLPRLDHNNAVARALGYRYKSENDEQSCNNCKLYQREAGTELGGCAIFPGRGVTAVGCCKSWLVKTESNRC